MLHGSGRTEDDLILFGRAVFPNSVLYAPRGTVSWENGFAFFRRKPDRQLDTDDLKHRATSLCQFIDFVFHETGQRPLLVGYSNGAIIAAETICLNRNLSKGAILLRPLSPRTDQALPNLSGYPILLLAGAYDERRHPPMRRIWPTNWHRPVRMLFCRQLIRATVGLKTPQTSGYLANGRQVNLSPR